MPDMPECAASGLTGMCANTDMAATFPAICTNPPNPHTGEAAAPVPGCTPAGSGGAAAPSPAPAEAGMGADRMQAPAQQPAVPASAAFSELAPQAAVFLGGALLAAMLV